LSATPRRAAAVRLRDCLEALRDHRGGWCRRRLRAAAGDRRRAPRFPADEIVVATHPEGRSNWLARHLVGRARARFEPPIHHVVVDAAGRRELFAA